MTFSALFGVDRLHSAVTEGCRVKCGVRNVPTAYFSGGLLVARRSMIGPVTFVFRYEGHRCEMSTSGDKETLKRIADESEVIEGVEVPTWIEYDTSGGADPDMHVRVELRDGSPVITELSWKSQPHQSDIRQKHLRKTDPAKLATDLVVSMIEKPVADPSRRTWSSFARPGARCAISSSASSSPGSAE